MNNTITIRDNFTLESQMEKLTSNDYLFIQAII